MSAIGDMALVDRLVPFLKGGKTRNDLVGLQGSFAESLANLVEQAPPDVRGSLGIVSAFRSPQRQAELFSQAVAKYGSEAAARKWVAPPGRSKHGDGDAVDLTFGAKGTPQYQAALRYAHDNAGKYGLAFPMGHEPWHIEPVGARGAKVLPTEAGGSPAGPAAPGGSPIPSMVTQSAPEMPAQAATTDDGPSLAGILTAAIGAFGANTPAKAASTGMAQVPQPEMPAKRPNLANILAGTSSPLLIGRPVA